MMLAICLASIGVQLVAVWLMCRSDDARVLEQHFTALVAVPRSVPWDPRWHANGERTGRARVGRSWKESA